MKMINCNIIHDLIPSYVDEICSDATKECVEQHISECNECRSMVNIYRDTEISNSNIEQKQIDIFKKFHNQMKLMNLFSMILVFLLIGLGIYTFFNNHIMLSTSIYYILFPICMIGLYLFTWKKGNMNCAEKKDYIVATLSIIDITCAIGFIIYVTNCVKSGRTVFSLEKSQLGSFVNNVWGILFLILGMGFVYLFFRMIGKNINNKCMLCLPMMGLFLLLSYVSLLRNLSSIAKFYGLFTQITVIIVTMGLVGVILFAVIDNMYKKNI